jgi:hypothetical protein
MRSHNGSSLGNAHSGQSNRTRALLGGDLRPASPPSPLRLRLRRKPLNSFLALLLNLRGVLDSGEHRKVGVLQADARSACWSCRKRCDSYMSAS